MDVEPAARTKHAEHLTHDLLRLIGVMQNTVRINIIKTSILKRKLPCVRFIHDGEIPNSPARQLHMLRRQIDSGSQRPMPGELQEIASRSASDFEDLISLMLAKLCGLVQPGIGGVALLLG